MIRKAGFAALTAAVVVLVFTSVCTADNALVQFYQKHISQVDGDRCPMAPSCSSYARQAIQKHGPVIGWIMACDRLVRCGRDEAKVSPAIILDSQKYVYDPVAANDFWWFKKEK